MAILLGVGLLVPGAVLGSTGSARGASAGPDIVCCGDFFSGVTDWANATNVTINFTAAFSGDSPVTLEWGNSTDPRAFSQKVSYSGSTLRGSVFLDFLEPSTTYDFLLLAGGGGECVHGFVEYYCYSSSSFSTKADTLTSISGHVEWAAGGHDPSGGVVLVYCASLGMLGGEMGVANANGAYSILLYYPVTTDCVGQPLEVTALNQATTGEWFATWNETTVVWGAQVVNFALPANYETGYTISVLDFSNAPPGYTNLGVESGTGYENSHTFSTHVSGSVGAMGAGYSSSATQTTGYTVGLGIGSTNGSLCYAEKEYMSGTVAYSAINRGWSFDFSPYGTTNIGNFCNQLGVTVPSTWMYPGTNASGVYYMLSPNGGLMKNVLLFGGNYIDWHYTISSTTTTSMEVSVSWSVSAALAGAIPVSGSVGASWSQSVSQSSSTTLSYTLEPPSGHNACFDVFGSGGSQSQNTADMIGIYYWAPVNGACTGG